VGEDKIAITKAHKQQLPLKYGFSEALVRVLEERQEALPEGQIGQEKLLQAIIDTLALEIQALNRKLEAQTERLETLEGLEELYHGKPPAQEERLILREVYQRKKEAQESLPSRVFGLEEDLQSLEQVVQSLKEKEPQLQNMGGKKTEARIKQIRQILKTSGGSQTFQELERSLGLSPQQFTYLVSHLDKRVFEISRRPGTKRGEKILSLRMRIKEVIVFT